MRLRTDDDIYRARLLYLGPPGYSLPVQLPYAWYGLLLLLIVVFMGVHYLFTFSIDLFPAWEIAAAIFTTAVVFKYVDPDRPARRVLHMAITDWRRTPEPTADQRLPRLVPGRVTIRDTVLQCHAAQPTHPHAASGRRAGASR